MLYQSRSSLPTHQRFFTLLITLLLAMCTSTEAFAARHRNSYYHRRAAAFAQAQRNQMIRLLKAQVSEANQVLKTAQSQASMSAEKVNGLMKNLDVIRHDMAAAHADIHDAAKELRLVEADILDDQVADSEFAKAEQDLVEANAALLHLASAYTTEAATDHEGATWSDLFGKLSKTKIEEIKADPNFSKLLADLHSKEAHIAAVRKKLFEEDKKWVAAKKALDKASQHSRTEVADARPDAVKVLTEKQELRQLQMVIENARLLAAQGEFRLRQLGVNTSSINAGSSRSK